MCRGRGRGETSVSSTQFCCEPKATLKNKILNNLGEYVLTSILERTKAGKGPRPLEPRVYGLVARVVKEKAGWKDQGGGERRKYLRRWSEHQLENPDQSHEQVGGLGESGWLKARG